MVSKIVLASLGIFVSASVAAAANTPATPGQPQRAEAVKPEAKKYCLTVEPLTGSRVEKTECKTKRQWAWEGIKVDQSAK